MVSCKSVLCLVGTSSVQPSLQANPKIGNAWNCWKLFNGKRCFRTQTVAKLRRGSREANGHAEAPQPAGLPFAELGNRKLTMSLLWKPFIFTASFSAGSFAGCALWQYENMRKQALESFINPNVWYSYSDKLFGQGKKRYNWREEVNKTWSRLTDAEKIFTFICAANALVFLAWRVPKFQPTMLKYFCSNPYSQALCWPLVLSTFSHYNAIHLVLNMYALNSFSKSAVVSLGREQFLGLYFAGGVISSFTSLFFKVAAKNPGFSVGASGAIMAVVGYLCAKFPNMELSIIGLPWYTFTAGNAIKTLIAFDLTGLILRWRFLDHAAHLGGALFGMAWCYWGNAYVWQKRDYLLQWWHELRVTVK